MTQDQFPKIVERKIRPRRRLALLASVAGIAILVLGAGAWDYRSGGFALNTDIARAAEPSAAIGGFADIVAKVKPAVIGIHVKITETPTANFDGQNGNQPPFESGSPLERYFRQFGNPDMPNAAPQRRVISGEGSGFFISADGYAVTNNHVVDHAKTVQVTADDGQTYTAKVIGTDEKTDLALIKVDGSNFPYVRFAEHESRVGDWVIAVGNPFGLGGTVTAGIVSARGRDIGAGPYDDFIQIDAPINKGNSGGPAFNINGEVIGVNTAIYSPSGGSVGIGFDIPAETAKTVIAQLKEKGSVTRGWIGVQVQPLTPAIANSLGMKKPEGALVDEPQAGSPAAKAGIESGDVITAINGTPIKDSRDLARKIAAMAPGTAVKVGFLRQGASKTIDLTLGTLPNQTQAQNSGGNRAAPLDGTAALGLAVVPAAEVTGAGNKGVVVTAVAPEGAAAEAGLQTGDVILDVAGKPVSSAADLRKAIGDLEQHSQQNALMRIKSGKTVRFVAMPIGHA